MKAASLIKLSLSEGGVGWRKSLRIFPIKILSSHRKFDSLSLSDLGDILRIFQKNKFQYEFNPDPEKVQNIVLLYFAVGCPSGARYEKEFPKGNGVKTPSCSSDETSTP